MKIRTGFVANSSSSSFIVKCGAIPVNEEDAGKVFFEEKEVFVAPSITGYLYEALKPVKIDFNVLEEAVKLGSYQQINKYIDSNDIDEKTCEILEEIIGEFSFECEYEEQINILGMVSNSTDKFDNYCKKNGLVYPKKQEDFKTYYDKKDNLREQYLEAKSEELIFKIKYFITDFKDGFCLKGEIEDDTEIGCEVEHYGPWEKFKAYRRFNHH